jgi:predicted dehydrogenase
MVGHTFLYSAPVRRIREIIQKGDIGEIRYISARRLNLGLFSRHVNVAWDLAPHDISIILYITGGLPVRVNCQGNSHVTPGIEDVTNMCLTFEHGEFATVQSSWLDPRKVREMTIVGSRRMIVYDDVQPLEKIRIYDTRVETPAHYDTFAEFQYAYHYGDSYIPYVKQEEPLKVECQHFLDCIRTGKKPLTDGEHGLNVVRILEASSRSLKQNGLAVELEAGGTRDARHEMRDTRNGARDTRAPHTETRISNGASRVEVAA